MSTSRRPTDADALAAAKFAYLPALDGLRVVCIYIILAGHMGAIHASNVAVDIFCVLSGFLITTLLLAEQARTGTVSIGRFLVRRAYRLMPGMWFYLLVGTAIVVVFKWDDIPYRDDYIGSALSAFFNVNNWYKVVHPLAGGRWLAHVWSLSMEEQFYLVWPAAFVLFMRSAKLRPYLLMFLLASVGLVMGWTYMTAISGAPRSRVYLAADTHIAPLLIGCMVAVWRDNRLRELALPADVVRAAGAGDGAGKDGGAGTGGGAARPTRGAASAATAAAMRRWTTGRRLAALGLPAGVTLLLLCFLGPNKDRPEPNWIDYSAYVPSAALAALLIIGADLNRDARWVQLLGAPKMAWTGKITYTIYLWHYPFISAAAGQLVHRIGLWPSVVAAAISTTITAYLVNRFVEKPIQARRPKWSDTPRGPAQSKGADDQRGRSDAGPVGAIGPDGPGDGRAARELPEPMGRPDLPELSDLPEQREVRQPAAVGAVSSWDGDVDWVDEGYPLRDRDRRHASSAARPDLLEDPGVPAGWQRAQDGPTTGPSTGPSTGPRARGPRPGDVTYDRPGGAPVYEHGPAVGTPNHGGNEPTPVPEWASYRALQAGADAPQPAGVAGPPGRSRAAAPGGETMNLQLPALADPRAEAGRRPSPRPGHETGRASRADGADAARGWPAPGRPGPGPGADPGPGRDRHLGLEPVSGLEHVADLQPVADYPPPANRPGWAGRGGAEPDPLFGPIPGGGNGR